MILAMAGLAGGLGFAGRNCGALTGGACLLALCAGKGAEEAGLHAMIGELVDWFEGEYAQKYGGLNCRDILRGNPRYRLERCPQIVNATYIKVREILNEHGYDPGG